MLMKIWPPSSKRDAPAARPLADIVAQRQARRRARHDSLRSRIGEAALAARRAGHPAFEDLWDAELRVYSQWGEDGILDFLCDCLDLVKPCALELGAGDFDECNTRFLAEHRQASVVAVDVHDRLVSSVKRLDLYWRNSLYPLQEWVTPANAPSILRRAQGLMGRVDIVSLDIDGNDYWVLASLDLNDVKILVVEYNALFGYERAVSVPPDDRFERASAHSSCLYYGASLPAWVHLLQSQGFTLVGTNRACSNAFFCPTAALTAIPVRTPDPAHLERYVDCRVRESCDANGRFTYLAGPQRLDVIRHLPVVDLVTNQTISLGEAQKPYGPR